MEETGNERGAMGRQGHMTVTTETVEGVHTTTSVSRTNSKKTGWEKKKKILLKISTMNFFKYNYFESWDQSRQRVSSYCPG